MIFINNFFYFALGVLFISVILPILEEIVQIILSLLELLKGKIMVPITKINCTIKKISDEVENESPKQIYPMGFCTTFDDEEEEEEGFEEDEDL